MKKLIMAMLLTLSFSVMAQDPDGDLGGGSCTSNCDTPGGPTVTVPEPSTMFLFGLGGLGLWFAARRK